MKCLVNWIPLNVHVRFEQNSTLIIQASLNPPFFVLWFSSSEGFWTFYYTSKLSKYFQRSKENPFWSKIPVIIAPNFEIGVKHCVPCVVFVFYHWTRCGNFHHVRPHGFERPALNRFSSHPSFAGLFRALQAPCWRREHLLDNTWKFSTQIFPILDCTHAHRVMFLFFPWTQATCFCCLNGVTLLLVSFGMLWTVSHVSLTYFITYLLVKAQQCWQFRQFSTAARNLKISNTALTQKRPGNRTKRPVHEQNPTDQKG